MVTAVKTSNLTGYALFPDCRDKCDEDVCEGLCSLIQMIFVKIPKILFKVLNSEFIISQLYAFKLSVLTTL
jgi:hypothetical protein